MTLGRLLGCNLRTVISLPQTGTSQPEQSGWLAAFEPFGISEQLQNLSIFLFRLLQ